MKKQIPNVPIGAATMKQWKKEVNCHGKRSETEVG